MSTKKGKAKANKGKVAKSKPVVKKAAPAPVTADEEPVADEAIAADAPVEAEDAASEATVTEASAAPKPTKAKKPKREAKTIEDLRADYERVVGRPTGSTNRAYLMWKVSEAKAGRVRVGPIERGAGHGGAPVQVLPLGMRRSTVALLDAAVTALGYKSRMAFIRAALVDKLAIESNKHAADPAIADAATALESEAT